MYIFSSFQMRSLYKKHLNHRCPFCYLILFFIQVLGGGLLFSSLFSYLPERSDMTVIRTVFIEITEGKRFMSSEDLPNQFSWATFSADFENFNPIYLLKGRWKRFKFSRKIKVLILSSVMWLLAYTNTNEKTVKSINIL